MTRKQDLVLIAIGQEVFGTTRRQPPSQVALATSDSEVTALEQGIPSPTPTLPISTA
jgi:hypothetical protein